MKNSLAASACLKAQHIFLTSCNNRAQHSEHSDDGNNPIVPARLPLVLDPSQLTRIDMLSSTIGSALYQEATVLIEEKRVQSNMKRKIEPHVEALGLLLSQPPIPSFQTFPCLRYTEERGGFRLVFQFPSSTEKARSLLSVLSGSNGPLPDVGTRLSLAVQVCQTLLSSHTAGWLHKDLRFENILLVSPLSAQSTDRLGRPYPCGFSFARQGEPSESFERYMDAYSLGCILIEIAEWTPLRKIIKKLIDNSSSVDVKLSDLALLLQSMHGRYITEGVASFRLGAASMKMLVLCIPAGDEKPDLADFYSALEDMAACIIEPPGRIVIFLIREPTPNTQKRSFNRRQNTDKRFVGNGSPDTCTYAESFNLAQEQLFIDGVPLFYNGQEYTELRARPVPPVRNPDVPDGAGFCLARDGTVYVTFTSGPAGCVPIILEVYDKRQCQNGRLVGLDTTTSAAETATSTSKAISSGSSTNIEESSSISQYQSVAPISEPTTSSKASTTESSSASTSSSFTTGITTSEASTEPTVSSPVPRESSTEGVSLTTALTLTSAVSTSSETEESTSIKPASSEKSEAGTTSSEESTSSVEPETSTVESTTAASESETTTVQTATSTESTTSEISTSESTTLETSTSESNTLQSSTLQSTSSESTTNRPSTTIVQTTSNSPTTTTLGATPTNTDECTALSNPYIASNGDRFDLSCSSNVVFLSGGGSAQADLVDCLEDCPTDPGCEGVQYTKANQNCVFLVQKVVTVPNNAYDVAFRG
ncbi:hypothetical protein QSH57_014428 [Fusarium oxysporum f. sp. vasinfectum]|nr:hypothetical protein QSH57_014428 [Fusarium oxysporum f. sp. vasinfectum]